MEHPEEEVQQDAPPRGPRPRNRGEEGPHVGEYALQLLVGIALAYLYISYDSTVGRVQEPADFPPEEIYKEYDQVIDGRTFHIIEAFVPAKKPVSKLSKLLTTLNWLTLLLFVALSTPRIVVDAGQQLRRMLSGQSALSRALRHETLSAVAYAVLIGFTAAGLGNVVQNYRYGGDCPADPTVVVSRSYLPMRDREHVKQFLRLWSERLQGYGGFATAVIKVGSSGGIGREELSNMQYIIVALTATVICTCDLLANPCLSDQVLKGLGLTLLVVCEGIWIVGRRVDLACGDRLACWNLLWHLAVIVALLRVPV